MVVVVVFIAIFLKMNGAKHKQVQDAQVNSTQRTNEVSETTVIDYSTEPEQSQSYEEITLSIEEIKKYREAIEQAGFDSTLYTDQEIQKMLTAIEKTGQSIAEYLKEQPDKSINDAEIEAAREELKSANIDPNKMHNNEIVELVRQAKKENKSVVAVFKEK